MYSAVGGACENIVLMNAEYKGFQAELSPKANYCLCQLSITSSSVYQEINRCVFVSFLNVKENTTQLI